MFECRAPISQQEFDQYYHLRWTILRKPSQQKQGSEKDDLERQAIHRAIFDDKGNIIAVARLHFCSLLAGQIRYMAVADDFQGKGLGQQLILSLEQFASRLGVTKLSLKAREQAISFYEKQSYKNIGFSHLLFNKIKHFNMEKTLVSDDFHCDELSTALQKTWHSTIPMSKAMKVTVGYYDQQNLVTTCDELFNKNLHNTMFAGSIYTLATLTGWGWVYLLMEQNNLKGNIVLADAKIRYHSPIAGIAFAKTGRSLSSGSIDNLLTKQKRQLCVEVQVMSGEKVAATFNGLYFVLPK
ncbi:acetyltransferase [Colwellia sp. PAMC 20917]|uniref:bifunctional GNAT family N-acetyltransferase/hotdog fold thioesterase n=1 Tax=Colwellia sp. PAMC 20917 TaxID=1816218 RepID=UPI0008780B3A|nr:bifunctional GNAT family N-acetyltransferase/hotdog fold thioesterase [Colwellia sp. PAMC 20917]AOW76945.1 acetyltransferase [Colwellia sp. PAMC 20917]